MSIWQVIRQLAYLLAKRKWEDDSNNEYVFNVVPTAGIPKGGFSELQTPFVLINALGGPSDEEHANYVTEQISLYLAVTVEGDSLGEFTLVGGSRFSGQGSSDGRGVLEVQEELAAVINTLSSGFGVKIQSRMRQQSPATEDEELGYLIVRQYLYEAKVIEARYYHPARLFVAPVVGSSVEMTWAIPPDRFDRYQMRLVRVVGVTATDDPTAGTIIPLSGNLATSHTEDPGFGTFSYSLFAGYIETSEELPPTSGTVERWSLAAKAEGIVVS